MKRRQKDGRVNILTILTELFGEVFFRGSLNLKNNNSLNF
jgi:hypothetical protein